eukprot:scaffold4163_cov425-Prasinococcus_capsulatus_cf.AAC.1
MEYISRERRMCSLHVATSAWGAPPTTHAGLGDTPQRGSCALVLAVTVGRRPALRATPVDCARHCEVGGTSYGQPLSALLVGADCSTAAQQLTRAPCIPVPGARVIEWHVHVHVYSYAPCKPCLERSTPRGRGSVLVSPLDVLHPHSSRYHPRACAHTCARYRRPGRADCTSSC